MLPTEVSLALEALSRDGWSSYLVAYRPSSPPHVFTDMDSATRHHLGLGTTGPSSMEVEELREDSRLVLSTLLIPIVLTPLLNLFILTFFFCKNGPVRNSAGIKLYSLVW